VTPRGLALLRDELAALERERTRVASAPSDAAERERRLAINTGRIAELARRIASATLVDPTRQPHDSVRFGATVTLRDDGGAPSRYTIVGVDEAAPAEGRIAFLAPLARALTGLTVGDTATLETASGTRELTVEAISYEGDDRK
jgi:transcription elongation factor GreB